MVAESARSSRRPLPPDHRRPLRPDPLRRARPHARVEPGDRAPLAPVRQAVLDLRRGKGMVLDEADRDTWSAGSFFTNPVVAPAVADDVARRAAAADQRPVTAWPTADGRVPSCLPPPSSARRSPAATPAPTPGPVPPPHARADQPRRRDDGRAAGPRPGRPGPRGGGVRRASRCRSPCSSGVPWI